MTPRQARPRTIRVTTLTRYLGSIEAGARLFRHKADELARRCEPHGATEIATAARELEDLAHLIESGTVR